MKRRRSRAVETQPWKAISKNCGGKNKSQSTRSPSRSSASSASSASSYSSRESEERRHYPLFTEEYARSFGRGNVPFLHMDRGEHHSHSHNYHQYYPHQEYHTFPLLRLRHLPRVQQQQQQQLQQQQQQPRRILYNEFVFLRELGKGTYAKVVLCCSLRTGELCALKIFRNEQCYQEAYWDELWVLEALCRPDMEEDTQQQQQQQYINNNNNNNNLNSRSRSCGGGDAVYSGENTSVVPATLRVDAFGGSAAYQGQVGRFNVPISHLPHPIHHAIVLPLLGPSLLDVLKRIRESVDKAKEDTSCRLQEKKSRERGFIEVCYRGLPLDLVRSILYQILLFLRHAHRRGIVHTDLKPENILFESNDVLMTRMHVKKYSYRCNTSYQHLENSEGTQEDITPRDIIYENTPEAPSVQSLTPLCSQVTENKTQTQDTVVDIGLPAMNGIRVIDVGAAEFLSKCRHKSVLDGVTPVFYHRIQTTHYRSVEVLLGLGWTSSVDMWSLGCIVPELLTGDCVFMPRNDIEHLALMQHIIGGFDAVEENGTQTESTIVRRVFAHGRQFEDFFDTHTMQLMWQHSFSSSNSSFVHQQQQRRRRRQRAVTAEDIRYVASRPTLRQILEPFPQLYDLCRRLLDYDPVRRITAAEALQHPFFTSAA